MATPTTSKKIQRVRQAGVKRQAGQRRPLGYPALIALICVLGLTGVLLARQARMGDTGAAPVAGKDKWVDAFGIYLCDDYLPNQLNVSSSSGGIDTHGDGLIYVHPPKTNGVSGAAATLQVFFDQIGLSVTDTSFTLNDGTAHREGDECADKKNTELKLFVWPPQSSDQTEPDAVLASGFGDQRLDDGGRTYVLALVPKGTKTLKLPASTDKIKSPGKYTAELPVASTTTVAPASSTPAETTTTAAPAETTTTAK